MNRRGERGYAMLLLFAMASVMAIMLYMALPRVAFESQRDQEALLIERGEQYKRAIQLYVRKFKKYPAEMKDLDSTQNLRFLRHHYVDPMTGKSEWRIIHVGAGGQLTDSLVKKATDKDKKDQSVNNFITELQPIGGGPQPSGPLTAAQRRRPSDQGQQPPTTTGGADTAAFPPLAQQGGFGTQPGVPAVVPQMPQGQVPPSPFPQSGQLPQQGQFGQPGQFPQQPGQFPQQPGQFPQQPGQFPQGRGAFGSPQQQQPTGGSGGMVGVLPGPGSVATYPGPPVNSQMGGVSPAPVYSTMPGAQGTALPPFPQPGGRPADPSQAPNPATAMIQNLLTTPRPGGLPGAAGGGVGGLQIGGGIAGVATTAEREGIMVYNDQTVYNKWEFVYDASKDKMVNPAAGMQQAPASSQSLNGPGLTTSTTPPTNPATNPAMTPPVNAFPPGSIPVQGFPGGTVPNSFPPTAIPPPPPPGVPVPPNGTPPQ